MLHVAQIISYGLLSGALYGLVALGLSLVFGVMNYLMIAHGGLIMLAAYATYWAYSYTHIDPFLLIIVVTPLFFVLGWVLFKVLYQSLMKFPEGEKIKNSMLISFGLLLIFSNLATLLWTADERSVTTFYTGGVIQVLGVRLPYIGLGGVVLAVAVIIALHLFLSRTYFGKAIRAVSMDHEAATLVGIDVSKVFLAAFSIGCALAAIPGVITSMHVFSPSVSYDLTNKALIVLILAGVGSVKGVLLGGLLLGAIEAGGVYIVGAPYREVFGLILFIVILMFRPQGLAGKQA
jgi:branched-chain amino acid transport system permease protein